MIPSPQSAICCLKSSIVRHVIGSKEAVLKKHTKKTPELLWHSSKRSLGESSLHLGSLDTPRNRKHALNPVTWAAERDRRPCQKWRSFASLLKDVCLDVTAADIKQHKWLLFCGSRLKFTQLPVFTLRWLLTLILSERGMKYIHSLYKFRTL